MGDTPNEARWCEEHERRECVKTKQGKVPCHQRAIRGLDVCQHHSGMRREIAKEKGAAITAWNSYGVSADVDYTGAVLGALQMTQLRLAVYSQLLAGQCAEGEDVKGLVERVYSASPDGDPIPNGEVIRGLVKLEQSERDRVVRFAKTAHDMGIDERMTSMYEQWGQTISDTIHAILDDLGLTPDQHRRVPDVVPRHLAAIEAPNTLGAA